MIAPYSLFSFADGEPFAAGCGLRLESDAELSLIPEITCLEYRSLTESDLSLLGCARYVEVRLPDGGFLCGGMPDDIETASRGGIRTTTVTLAASPDIYRASVSLTVRPGATVSETLAALLRPAGMTAPSVPDGLNTAFPRPRSFCCAVSEAVDAVAEEIGASVCVRRGRLFMLPAVKGRLSAILAEPASVLPGDIYDGRLVFRRRLTVDTSGSARRMKLEVISDNAAKVS